MSDCDHEFVLESIESPTGTEGRGTTRTIWLACTICSHRQPRLTQRTDAEIQAALAELDTP